MQIPVYNSAADLKAVFAPLFGIPIQTFKKKGLSLLDAAGYPDYENVLSNLYQFFINDQEHGIGRLFMLSLQDCLDNFNIDIQMSSWNAKREVSTERGRIDIVIEENGNIPGKVIIIENKLYHSLTNDLKEYFDYYQDASQRVGIVLSLRRINNLPQPFVSITHNEWIQAVKSRIGDVLSEIPLKHFIFLQDFIAHVESYYEKPLIMDSYKFLFENAEKIAALNDLQQRAIDQIKKEVYEAVVSDWEQYRSSASSIAFKRKELSMVLYITTDGLFKAGDHHFAIQLWLKGQSLVALWDREALSPNLDGINLYTKKSTIEWLLIAFKRYPLDLEDIVDFKTVVSKYLSGEWEKLIEQFKLIQKNS